MQLHWNLRKLPELEPLTPPERERVINRCLSSAFKKPRVRRAMLACLAVVGLAGIVIYFLLQWTIPNRPMSSGSNLLKLAIAALLALASVLIALWIRDRYLREAVEQEIREHLKTHARFGRLDACRQCGYDQRGTTTDRCPECGASVMAMLYLE